MYFPIYGEDMFDEQTRFFPQMYTEYGYHCFNYLYWDHRVGLRENLYLPQEGFP